MDNKRKVTRINNLSIKWKFNVAVYCRVSTPHAEQIESLSNQIEYYRHMVSTHIDWVLVDIYADIQSGKNSSGRPEFQRMLEDCRNKKIDLIITKSVSRFGRNTVDTLDTINKLPTLNVDLFFEVENIHISETSKTFLMSILGALAQAESEARSQNIKWGIRRGFESGTSKFYNRKCYGYYHDLEGNILINEQESVVVNKIFNLYLSGFSTLAIIRELNKEGIKSPTGKESWPKRTIDTILSNEKYMGNVIVGKTYTTNFLENERHINNGEQDKYQSLYACAPLISKEQFEQVQKEKLRRSNIHKNADGTISRTSTHYSMKSDSDRNESL
jgi:DNA invertase Pin-like site-specific DNA recombinase